jgi:hypothetical protein
VIAESARQLYTRKNPTIFLGPLYLWARHPDWIAKGQALLPTCGGDSQRHDYSHAGLPTQVPQD